MVDEAESMNSLIDIFVDQMDTHKNFISPETKLKEFKMDDLDAVEICLRINSDFEVKLCDKFLSKASGTPYFTVAHLMKKISRLAGVS